MNQIKKLEEALKQIEKRGYDTVMRQRGIKKILKIGLAFYGKEIKIKYSE